MTIVVFAVGLLSSIAFGLFVLLTLSNPYPDITKAWTTILAVACFVVAVGAWIAFRQLQRRAGHGEELER